jgi:hypothetical protein
MNDNIDLIFHFHPLFSQNLAWTNSSQICDKSVRYYVIIFKVGSSIILKFFNSVILAWIYSGQVQMHLNASFSWAFGLNISKPISNYHGCIDFAFLVSSSYANEILAWTNWSQICDKFFDIMLLLQSSPVQLA